MQCERKKKQLNNGGFSLLEVLVAMVILAIVSIPLLHSFVTTARTNAKAKVLMKATDVAENTVETFKNQDVETLIAQYSAGTGNSVVVTDGMQSGTYTAADDGIVQFSVYNQGDFSLDLPKGYYMEVELNPNLYPNANAVNMAEMNTVSATTSGVYRMLNDFDNMVYETFALRSANAPAGYGYVLKDEKYFKENLKREKIPVIKFDNLVDGGSKAVSAAAFYEDYSFVANSFCSSEGENILMNVGRLATKLRAFIQTGESISDRDRFARGFAKAIWGDETEGQKEVPNERWILLDAVDSGLSIDNVVDLKEGLFEAIMEDKGNSSVYIIVTANGYEMARNENCFDVYNGKYVKFKDYEDYRQFVLKSKEIKEKR